MATDRLTVPFECPACREDVPMPTATRYELGREVVAIDTGPVREHIRDRHGGGDYVRTRALPRAR
jgi:hypothetical protein